MQAISVNLAAVVMVTISDMMKSFSCSRGIILNNSVSRGSCSWLVMLLRMCLMKAYSLFRFCFDAICDL